MPQRCFSTRRDCSSNTTFSFNLFSYGVFKKQVLHLITLKPCKYKQNYSTTACGCLSFYISILCWMWSGTIRDRPHFLFVQVLILNKAHTVSWNGDKYVWKGFKWCFYLCNLMYFINCCITFCKRYKCDRTMHVDATLTRQQHRFLLLRVSFSLLIGFGKMCFYYTSSNCDLVCEF